MIFPFPQGFDGKDGARGESGAPGPKVKTHSVLFAVGRITSSIICYFAVLCILHNYKYKIFKKLIEYLQEKNENHFKGVRLSQPHHVLDLQQ